MEAEALPTYIIQGVPKQADKSKVIKHIKNLPFLGCLNNQTDHQCWLFDISYKDSWIFSYNSHYDALICNNAKSVKFSYWDCLQPLWYFWIFHYLKTLTFSRYSSTMLNMTSNLRFSAFLPENVSSSYLMFYWTFLWILT